jgi:hypothetical protein
MHEMDSFKRVLTVFISVHYLQFAMTNNFDLFNNSPVLYICFFDVKRPEDDLKKIETCRSISELCVSVSFNTFGFFCVSY